MKIFFLLNLLITMAHAGEGVPFYTVRTEERYSREELEKKCNQDLEDAAVKLAEISQRLSPANPNALSVSSTYGAEAHSTGTSRSRRTYYVYYCLLNFKSENPALVYDKYNAIRLIRIGRGDWDTACDNAYEAAVSNQNSPVTMEWKFWTLIQGRACDVSTIEIKEKLL